MMEERFMGIDVGTRRIGVAASTPGGGMVLPVETVDGRDVARAARRILELAGEYEAAGLVVGWPVDMRGRAGRATERVERFLKFLNQEMEQRKAEVPIHRWDERMSTMAADRLLEKASLSRERRKEAIDQVAACEILKGFLDQRRLRLSEER